MTSKKNEGAPTPAPGLPPVERDRTLGKVDFNQVLHASGLELDDPMAHVALKETSKLNKLMGLLALLGITPEKILGAVVNKIKGMGQHQQQPAPTPTPAPTPAPTPTPGTPTPEPVPSPLPVPTPTTSRILAALRCSFFWYQRAASEGVVGRSEFEAIINRSEPMVPRSRMAVDADTIDQYGQEIRPEHWTPELVQQLLWYRADDTGERDGAPRANTQRIRWYFAGGDGVAEVTENGNGTVPKIKIGANALEEDNRDYETGELYAIYEAPDGRRVESNRMPSLRAKR